MRPERESHPRMAVLQTAAFLLRHPANCFHILASIWYTKLNMRTRLIGIICLLIFSAFLSGCSLNIFGKKSGVQITSNPQAEVTVNGQSNGKTPYYTESLKSGEYTIRLTPIDPELQPWETKTTLSAGHLTIVDRQFGKTQDQSSSFTLSFEKLSNKNSTEVSIISNPSNVSVAVDKAPIGFSNRPIENISAGDHSFDFVAPGYQDKRIQARVYAGMRLVINITMAAAPIVPTPTPTPLATPSGTLTATPTPTIKTVITPLPKQSTSSALLVKPYVEILPTPLNNTLRVRAEASVGADEVAKVNTGDKFPYKDMETAGWYYIEYLKDQWGYVSSQYAKLVK
ncbi:MAG: Family 10 xylanase [Candidatus Collierbacteria bacterium GW2011_GWF2_44_15]|uniref:Family 10 xylanase n=2 Tax=Candidatus Collieribacteriota TaxID=1752725 RepID=A0A0G1HIW5_9BACT|nr:MAG: Family 10 xylanase [Candidatus Collierbacteria bacterium GW2011_GWF2_44_15]